MYAILTHLKLFHEKYITLAYILNVGDSTP